MRSGVASTSHFGHPSPFFVFLSRSWSALHIPTDIFFCILRGVYLYLLFFSRGLGGARSRYPRALDEEGGEKEKSRKERSDVFLGSAWQEKGRRSRWIGKEGLIYLCIKEGDGDVRVDTAIEARGLDIPM